MNSDEMCTNDTIHKIFIPPNVLKSQVLMQSSVRWAVLQNSSTWSVTYDTYIITCQLDSGVEKKVSDLLSLNMCLFMCFRYQRAPAVWMKPCRRVWCSWRRCTPSIQTTCPSSRNCRDSWTIWSIWWWRCLSGAVRISLWVTWLPSLSSMTGTGN